MPTPISVTLIGRGTSPGSASVVMLDPGNFTPYYVDGLCGSLSELGIRARVITSPPLFEPVDSAGRYDVEWLFFPWLTGRFKFLLRRRTRLRQAIKAASYPGGIWRTWRTLRRSPAGVLHIHWALFPQLDGLLVRALRARGWRIVFTVHDPLPGADRRVAYRQYQALLAPIDVLIAHTPHLARQIVSAYPDVAGKVHVVAHGGAALPLPSVAERAQARRSLGVEGDEPVLLFFGMIKPYKGLEYLLEAMPKVLGAFPQARLVIAGEPLMPVSTIESQIERLQVGNSVLLRPSFVPHSEVSRYFAAADMLVAPYVEVAASGVIVMAQGYGLPVVTTRVGGLPEFVQPDACGFVVPPRSAEPLADAICRALADREALAKMGRRAWRRIARDNGWSDVARRTLNLYQAPADSVGRAG